VVNQIPWHFSQQSGNTLIFPSATHYTRSEIDSPFGPVVLRGKNRRVQGVCLAVEGEKRELNSPVKTSNRPLDDWGKLLRDNAALSAIQDRLLHRGHLLKFEGKRYCLKEASVRLTEKKRKSSGLKKYGISD
jgi:hypothetical protein